MNSMKEDMIALIYIHNDFHFNIFGPNGRTVTKCKVDLRK